MKEYSNNVRHVKKKQLFSFNVLLIVKTVTNFKEKWFSELM